MKFLVIFALALIAIADAQFRFTNPFRGFRLPSFRRPSRPQAPSRPRAPRVNGASFRPTGTFSRPNAIFEIQSPSIPVRPSSVSSAPVVNAPVVQTAPVGSSAIREIPAPDMTLVAQPAQPAQPAVSTVSSSGSSSSDSGSNHQWQGRNYVLSWREGRNGFSHSAARSYCRGKGMRIVSLDNIQKAQHFLDLVERNNVPYFWAGGQISSYVFHRKNI